MAFLGCFMEGFQCSIEDMPCFDASVFTAAPSPATTSPTPASAATEHPTASPTLSSSYEDRGFEMTASPSSTAEIGVVTLPAGVMEACAEETEACVSDEACRQGCVTGYLEVRALLVVFCTSDACSFVPHMWVAFFVLGVHPPVWASTGLGIHRLGESNSSFTQSVTVWKNTRNERQCHKLVLSFFV